MVPRFACSALLIAGLVSAPSLARAQLISGGIGPVFPTGDVKDLLDPGTGLILSGRVGLGVLPLLQLQIEATSVQNWEVDDGLGGGSLDLTTGGANLALHFVRIAPVRPYALAGLLVSRQTGGALDDDDSWRLGYQTGLGLDFRLGPLTPFAELRWVSLDGPGGVRITYVPLLIGIKVL